MAKPVIEIEPADIATLTDIELDAAQGGARRDLTAVALARASHYPSRHG